MRSLWSNNNPGDAPEQISEASGNVYYKPDPSDPSVTEQVSRLYYKHTTGTSLVWIKSITLILPDSFDLDIADWINQNNPFGATIITVYHYGTSGKLYFSDSLPESTFVHFINEGEIQGTRGIYGISGGTGLEIEPINYTLKVENNGVIYGGGGAGGRGGDGSGLPQNPIEEYITEVFDVVGSGTWTVPEGVTEVEVCMVAGGGAGGSADSGNDEKSARAYGGYAGEEYSGTLSVNPGDSIPYEVGAGGSAALISCGGVGGDTVFGSITVVGGARGCEYSGYSGTGGSGPLGCGGGGYIDGRYYREDEDRAWGGQASSFGNGGDAYRPGRPGGTGAGGGGCSESHWSGAGGRGEIRIKYRNPDYVEDPCDVTETIEITTDTTWTVPDDVYEILVEIQAPGGGGYYGEPSDQEIFAGESGECYVGRLPVLPGQDVDIRVGQPGQGGDSSDRNGKDGGNIEIQGQSRVVFSGGKGAKQRYGYKGEGYRVYHCSEERYDGNKVQQNQTIIYGSQASYFSDGDNGNTCTNTGIGAGGAGVLEGSASGCTKAADGGQGKVKITYRVYRIGNTELNGCGGQGGLGGYGQGYMSPRQNGYVGHGGKCPKKLIKKTFTQDSTWTVPADVTSVKVCMVGGGGGGSTDNGDGGVYYTGGGYAGEEYLGDVTVTPGEVIDIKVGASGRGAPGEHSNGYSGGESKFGFITVSGGAGGVRNGGYQGQGAEGPDGCGGEATTDGSKSGKCYGGQASSFGSGGSGNYQSSGHPQGGHGGVGAGGGAAAYSGTGGAYGGNGGRGEVQIEYYSAYDQSLLKDITKVFTGDAVWTVPEGVTEIEVCMIGGGGGGAWLEDESGCSYAGGGHAGEIYHDVISVTPGDSYNIKIGAGGSGAWQGGDNDKRPGSTGGKTKFGSIEVNGGAGGTPGYCYYCCGHDCNDICHSYTRYHYKGDGATRSTCFGEFRDGRGVSGWKRTTRLYGGQAGLANGGDAKVNAAYGNDGSMGSGGGSLGMAYPHARRAGNGGSGAVILKYDLAFNPDCGGIGGDGGTGGDWAQPGEDGQHGQDTGTGIGLDKDYNLGKSGGGPAIRGWRYVTDNSIVGQTVGSVLD